MSAQRHRVAEALVEWLHRQEGVELREAHADQVGPLGGISSQIRFDVVSSEGTFSMALNLYDLSSREHAQHEHPVADTALRRRLADWLTR